MTETYLDWVDIHPGPKWKRGYPGGGRRTNLRGHSFALIFEGGDRDHFIDQFIFNLKKIVRQTLFTT